MDNNKGQNKDGKLHILIDTKVERRSKTDCLLLKIITVDCNEVYRNMTHFERPVIKYSRTLHV